MEGPALPAGNNPAFGGPGSSGKCRRRPAGPEDGLGVYGPGTVPQLAVAETASAPAGVMLPTGAPFNEPVARCGPLVRNTPEEIVQASRDSSFWACRSWSSSSTWCVISRITPMVWTILSARSKIGDTDIST